MLTCQIMEAATTQALLSIAHAHKNQLDSINLAACWSSVGTLARRRPVEQRWLQRNAKAFELLVQHTGRKADAGEIGARPLANTAHGAAHSSRGESLVVLFAALSRASGRRVDDFNVQNLANTS